MRWFPLFAICVSLTFPAFGVTKEDHQKMISLVHQAQAVLEKDPTLAQKLFEEALSIEKTDTAYKGLGWSQWKQHRPEKALPVWLELSQKNPNDLKLLNQLAKLQIENKDMDAAEKTYKSILQKDLSNADALAGLANILNGRHDYQASQELYEKLSQKDSVHSQKFMKAWGISLYEQRNYTDALPKFESAVNQNSNDATAQAYLGMTLYRLGKYDTAIPMLKNVTNQNPKQTKALETLLLYAKYQNDWKEAERILRLLVASAPTNTIYLNSLAAAQTERKEYSEAIATYEKSLRADSNQVEPRINISEIHSRQGMPSDEVQAYDKSLLTRFPNIAPRIGHGILDAYESSSPNEVASEEAQKSNTDDDNDLSPREVKRMMERYPADLSIQLRLSRMKADENHFDEAYQLLNNIEKPKFIHAKDHEKEISSVAIPSLLYHRITQFPGEGVVTAAQFEDQMKQLRVAGYQSISVYDLENFYLHAKKLPVHPILITFDDAIKDSMIYADPILEKYHFQATMFVPTHIIEKNNPFFMTWNDLGKLKSSGRWDLQCHSDYGHELIPIDSNGHQGRFLVNRKWLSDENRLENEDEFVRRVQQDYVNCKTILETKFPGQKVIAYSFPFGDFGTESSTNSKTNVADLNTNAARKNYSLAFVQRFPGFNIASTLPYLSMRINVNAAWTGSDLINHLHSKDPIVLAKSLRATILIEQGQGDKAIALANQEGLKDKDPKTYYQTLFSAYGDMGNSVEALRLWDKIGMNSPDNELRKEELSMDLKPTLQFGIEALRDSSDRTVVKPLVRSRVQFYEHLFGTALYEHGFYTEDRASVPALEQDARGDILGMGLEYKWDDDTKLTATGGFERFDTGYETPLVNGEFIFPIVRDYLSFDARYNRGALELARALHYGIDQNEIRGDLLGNSGHPFTYRFLVDERWLSDQNRIFQASVRADQKVYERLGLYVGADLNYQDSQFNTVFYYAPQSLRQALGEIGINRSWRKVFRTNLFYKPGIADESSSGTIFVQEIGTDSEWQIGNHFNIELEAGYDKEPQYHAVYGSLLGTCRF